MRLRCMRKSSLLLVCSFHRINAFLPTGHQTIIRQSYIMRRKQRGAVPSLRHASTTDDSSPQTTSFFLLKSEPSEFSIDDLKNQKGSMDEWDGVRNFEARNIMRSMKVGDKAFFYHSNCKNAGVVGTVTISREAIPDVTAYEDPSCPGYDPKSTAENCRWDAVQIRLESIFPVTVTLKEMKSVAKQHPIIEDMTLLKRGRLSVHRISSEEWAAVNDLVDRKAGGDTLI